MTAKKISLNSESKLTRESAAEHLSDLRRKYGEQPTALSTANEAKTRLLLIDSILEALGWSRDDFNPEEPAKNVGFMDYLISVDGIPQFIVEAKRVGETFGHPNTGLRKTDYQLSFIRGAFGPAVSDVINQAESYCIQTGVAHAVVTNGAEWFLFQAIPYRNHSIENLRCIYFGNLLSETSSFDFFWELLAKPRVLSGSLEEHFWQLNAMSAEFCSTPKNVLPEISWTHSNDCENHLLDFYDRFFDEITDPARRQMLEHCFVTNARLDQYQGDLRRVLQDSAPSFIPNARSITPDDEEELFFPDSGDQKGRVVLVTGSVGCGKSTLVTRVLTNQNPRKRNLRKFKYLIVNLIDEFDGNSDIITNYLWQEVDKQWRKVNKESYEYETLRRVFARELDNLRRGPKARVFEQDIKLLTLEEGNLLEHLSSSPEDFLTKSWRYYCRHSGKGVVVFLDNVDRASENYQRLVYAFAHKLANKTGATVIITMREVTYFRGQQFGFLDVRSDDIVYHLQSPDLIQILSKRIQYVEFQMGFVTKPGPGDLLPDHRLRKWRKAPDWFQFQTAAQKYLEVLKATFLKSPKDANQLISLLAALAWHDVRYFLGILRSLHLMLGSDSETWSLSEIVAALMIPSGFTQNQPTLATLYIPSYIDYPCYFLKSRILLMLRYGRQGREMKRGTGLKLLFSFTRMYRYPERWTRRAIQEMVRERLLECLEVPSAADYTKDYELQDEHSFRASPLAIMLLDYVQFDYIYLSLLGNDLPFHRHDVFNKFIKETKDVIGLLATELHKDSLDLLPDTKAGQTVAQYLIEAFYNEQPLGNATMHNPEVSATEQNLKTIVDRLRNIAGCIIPDWSTSVRLPNISVNSTPEPIVDEEDIQLELFDTAEFHKSVQSKNIVQIPTSLVSSRGKRSWVPCIFWALVELRARGETLTTGSAITRVINQYLVNDLSKAEPTNISRSLRSSILQSQSWLITHHPKSGSKKKLYGLSDDWSRYWEDLFEEVPPELNT